MMFDRSPSTDAPTYDRYSGSPTTVAAFDTDMTVDYAGGPVPLTHVKALRDAPDVAVFSTGHNQTLRDRAEIPGMHEVKDARGRGTADWVERADRMRMLKKLYPDADRYTCNDDECAIEFGAETARELTDG